MNREVISSISNPQIKQVVRLRGSRARRRLGRFLIDGELEIRRALEAGLQVETLFQSVENENSASAGLAKPKNIRTQLVTSAVMQHISYGQRANHTVAVAVTPTHELSTLRLDRQSLVLVLDRTEKPGNLGACLRTAAACAVDAVILTSPVCELYNPNTIRASRGTIFQLPVASCSAEQLLAMAEDLGWEVYAARVDGTASLWECNFVGGRAIVLGNETDGLGRHWSPPAANSFQIPMSTQTDSLNVSISAAVTLYEAIRQRDVHSQQKFDLD